MPSRKVADAHILFSAEGLAGLEKDAKGAIDRILDMMKGAETPEGPFSKGLLRDISLMKDMNRAVASLISQQRELSRSVASGPTAASNIRNAMAGDTESRLAKTRAFATHQLSGRGQEAAAVSPTLLKANRDFANSQRNTILEMQSSLADFGVNSEQLSIKQGVGFNKSKGTANFIAENIGGVEVGRTADSMRMAAQEFRDIIENVDMPDVKDESSKELDSFINKIKMMASELDVAAQKTEEYTQALKMSRSLTSDQKSGVRGNLRDIDQAEQRVAASLGRQQRRDFLAADPSELMGRRLGEIGSNEQLSDIGKNQEVSLAAQEIANALRMAATGVREAGIDSAMREAAEKLSKGLITPEQFRSDMARAQAGKRGVTAAEDTLRNADFRSRNKGQTEGEVSQDAELGALRERSNKIQELIDNEKDLTAEEKERLSVEKDMLGTSIKLKEAELKLSKEIKKREDRIRSLTAERSDLSIKEAKGISLTKAEKQEIKSLNAQLDREHAALTKLKVAHSGVNEKLHAGAQSSRRFNFMIQQASYGVQDFVQVIGQTGLSGALRASANNMASLFAAMGTTGGAIAGGVGTIAMIGLADIIQNMGDEAESTEEKIEKLTAAIDRMTRARERSRQLSEDLFGGQPGDFGRVAERIRSGLEQSGDSAAEMRSAKLKGESIAESIIQSESITSDGGFWKTFKDKLSLAMQGGSERVAVKTGSIDAADIARIRRDQGKEAAQAELNRQADSPMARARRRIAESGDDDAVTKAARIRDREERRERQRVQQQIVDADLGTAEGNLAIAAELAGETDEIRDARSALKDAREKFDAEKRRQLELFKGFQKSIKEYVNESVLLMKFRTFDQASRDATSLASGISETRSRIEVAQDRVDNAVGPEAESAQLALDQEKAILKELMDAFRKITEEALKLPSGLSKFSTSLQGIRSELADKLRGLEKAGVLTPEIHARLVEQSIQDAGALAEGHSGRASRQFGENQRQANERVREEIAAQRVAGGGPLDAVYDMVLEKMDEFERDFMKIAPDRSGISGRLASGIDTFERRRDEREKVLGSDAQFDKENISDIMRQMSDSIMSFSGNVERKLGETQEEANEREKKRLDDLIAQVTASADTDDDSLIPFFQLTKRKIDEADKEDLQAKTGTTSIESLHSTIQDSLTGDTKEFDLQVEQRDLLQQINNGIAKIPAVAAPVKGGPVNGNQAVVAPDPHAELFSLKQKRISLGKEFRSLPKDGSETKGFFGGNRGDTQKELDYVNEEIKRIEREIRDSSLGGGSVPDMTSNVNTDSATQAAAATDESLKYQQASSETLKEMLNFFKTRVDSGGLVIS